MNIGDIVYYVKQGRNQFTVTCPECAGKRAHHIVLGNGEEHDIPCVSCAPGFENPRGTIQTWKTECTVDSATIEQMKMGREGPVEFECRVFYQGNTPEESGFGNRTFKVGEVFTDRDVAQVKADAATDKLVDFYVKTKKDQHRKWAWHVTYYRGLIRRAKEDIERSEAQLVWAQSKAK